jgi:hypothetical protein
MSSTGQTTDGTLASETDVVGRRRVKTAVWALSAKGSGTVTYHRYRLPGRDDECWPEALPGAVCERKMRGGAYLASERHASSVYSYDPLPVGTRQITIEVSYRHGRKTGSSRRERALAGYRLETREDGTQAWMAVWDS